MEGSFSRAVPSFHAMSTIQFYCVLCGVGLQTSSNSRYDLMRCPCCSRHVPVPRPASGPGNLSHYPPVFPPDVLELSVKFLCTACGSALRADARCEGREVTCPDCGGKTGIPRWSNVPGGPRLAEAGEQTEMAAARPP